MKSIAEPRRWLTSKLRVRGWRWPSGTAVAMLIATVALGWSLAPAAAAKAKPKFESWESIVGTPPSACDPAHPPPACPSSNPFDPGSEWYEADSRLQLLQVQPRTGKAGPGVVHVGDYVRSEVLSYEPSGQSVDTSLYNFDWSGSPTGALERTGTGCGPGHPDAFCVFTAKQVTHGWARVVAESFVGGGDSPSIRILSMDPVAIVAQYTIEVEDNINSQPVTLIALDAKGHAVAVKKLTTNSTGSLQELVTQPGKFIVFVTGTHGSSFGVECVNGKRIHYRGTLACKLTLTNKHPFGGDAVAYFTF